MKDTRRKIPSVSDLLKECSEQPWAMDVSREELVDAIRIGLDHIRQRLLKTQPAKRFPSLEEILDEIRLTVIQESAYSLQRVINASGVVVHTNLGRAPFSSAALRHLHNITAGYSNLEMDLKTGQRGSRDEHLEKLLHNLFGTEGSLVVNNNAAALLLILNSMAEGKEVIVSRGELIEIGGSFRLPEIMKKSGAILREVGTTNKTRTSDYRKAVSENTAMILIVHPSNFQIVGFTEKPDLKKLIDLGIEKNIPVVEDHGSGILVDMQNHGIAGEPAVQQRLQYGLDLICFSGDKILGASQAGIVCGKKVWIDKLRSNPLFRALRVDKTTYAVLEATLSLYRKGKADEIPVIRMISQSFDDLHVEAVQWVEELRSLFPEEEFGWEETLNYIGGGVAPMKSLRSAAVSISLRNFSAQELATEFRNQSTPILARIESDRLLLELRTLTKEDRSLITKSLAKILNNV